MADGDVLVRGLTFHNKATCIEESSYSNRPRSETLFPSSACDFMNIDQNKSIFRSKLLNKSLKHMRIVWERLVIIAIIFWQHA